MEVSRAGKAGINCVIQLRIVLLQPWSLLKCCISVVIMVPSMRSDYNANHKGFLHVCEIRAL